MFRRASSISSCALWWDARNRTAWDLSDTPSSLARNIWSAIYRACAVSSATVVTVGGREAYAQAFREMPQLFKQGKGQREGQPYDGGAAFETESDARAFLR